MKKKKKNFEIFPPFLKTASNFEYFKEDMTLITYVFPDLQTAKDLVKPLSKKRHFRAPFENQHVKKSLTLAKYS